MTKRKLVTVSLTDEIVKVLEQICEDTGLDKSKVIQELILKAGGDKKTREIITANNYARVARKKMSGSSHNVHCVNQKENASPEPYPEEAGHPARGTFPIVNEWDANIQRTIEIAKAKWVQDDDEEWKDWWE